MNLTPNGRQRLRSTTIVVEPSGTGGANPGALDQSENCLDQCAGAEPAENLTYPLLIERIREITSRTIPPGASIVVVSKGDNQLVWLNEQWAWHFPQAENGQYAGYYPKTGTATIAHLETLRARGGTHFLLPRPAFWWLDYYRDLTKYLHRHSTVRWADEHCQIYEFRKASPALDGLRAAYYAKIVPAIRRYRLLPAERRNLRLKPRTETSATQLAGKIDQPKDVSYQTWAAACERIRYRRGKAVIEIGTFAHLPTISIVMPVYNTPADLLERAISSVLGQYYPHWELCICDDASSAAHVRATLESYQRVDRRIKCIEASQNGGISAASNLALALATGEFIGLLDHDDELTPDALFEVAAVLQGVDADVLYSDEDKLDDAHQRCYPFFKPAWCPDLLLSCMYLGHFIVYRKSVLDAVGGFRSEYDGSQDYDLALRVTERTERIVHIPKVLYHWRKTAGSAAGAVDAKPYAYEAARRALSAALRRRDVKGTIQALDFPGYYATDPGHIASGKVSIIVSTRDALPLVKTCLDSVERRTDYRDYEIIIVDNGSRDAATLRYLRDTPHIVIRDDGPFNFSRLQNMAVDYAHGDYLLFLNNDTEVIESGWLQAMLAHAQRADVGAVGAKLLYPDDRIQHAGVVLGIGGLACHAHKGLEGHWQPGYFGFARVTRNYSAVTAACMMVRRSLFAEIGGFNEKSLPVAFNDVDLCLRLRERGYLIVYEPRALLYHHESASRGKAVNPLELQYMLSHWEPVVLNDPYYHPNLTLACEDFGFDFEKRESLYCCAGNVLCDDVISLNDKTTSQRFIANKDGLCAVSVLFSTYRCAPAGEVVFRLYAALSGERGDELHAAVVDARAVRDGQYHTFGFEAIKNSEGRTFCFSLELRRPGTGHSLNVRKTCVVNPRHGPYFEGNDTVGSGTLSFKAYCSQRYRMHAAVDALAFCVDQARVVAGRQ